MRRLLRFVLPLAVLGVFAFPPSAAAFHNMDAHSANMSLVFEQANPTGAINSDIAFWGNRAYYGDYDSLRIFDISNPAAPRLLSRFVCHGPQNDPVVWQNRLVFLAIDRTQSGPQCATSVDVAHDDPQGWEGVRIIDVSNPAAPRQVGAVYSDCGAHTIALHPAGANLHLYVSSYPLRPGPTCGQVRGPAAGRDPLHGVIQVIEIPLANPAAAREIAEPRITYPGDPDNRMTWAEHDLAGPGLEPAARACHDISVFVPLNLAAAACAEQSQLWRIGPNGIPDTQNPIWVFDDSTDTDGAGGGDVAVDFHHSATFSWDGKYVNFIDESFGSGCPPVTPIGLPPAPTVLSDTGRMFFLSVRTGALLSRFTLPRPEVTPTGVPNYCSAHLGNVSTAIGRYLLANAWYTGGVDLVDFTRPANPFEAAFYDIANRAGMGAAGLGSDNWSGYHYENTTGDNNGLWFYATHGVENPPTGRGAQVYRIGMNITDLGLRRLNPQTHEDVFRCRVTASPRTLRAGAGRTLSIAVRAVPGISVLPGQGIGDVPVRLRGPGIRVDTRTNSNGTARVRGVTGTRRGILRIRVPDVPNMLGCSTRVGVTGPVRVRLTGRTG